MMGVIIVKPFIRNLQLLLEIVAKGSNSKSKTPRVRYSRHSRTFTISLSGDRGEREEEPATTRDREAYWFGYPQIPDAGLCPHGALVKLCYNPFPPQRVAVYFLLPFLIVCSSFSNSSQIGSISMSSIIYVSSLFWLFSFTGFDSFSSSTLISMIF